VFAEGTGVKESQLQGKVGAKGEAAGEVCHFDLLELLFGAPREQTAPIPLLVLEGLKGGKLAIEERSLPSESTNNLLFFVLRILSFVFSATSTLDAHARAIIGRG